MEVAKRAAQQGVRDVPHPRWRGTFRRWTRCLEDLFDLALQLSEENTVITEGFKDRVREDFGRITRYLTLATSQPYHPELLSGLCSLPSKFKVDGPDQEGLRGHQALEGLCHQHA